ncbi:MAG: Endo,4-beta-xylanase precursor [Labilithrix sp.]|nr:Endo,4-beta-xylanase precursor [Labilithrix sp.]
MKALLHTSQFGAPSDIRHPNPSAAGAIALVWYREGVRSRPLRRVTTVLALAALGAAGTLAACGDDDGGGEPGQDSGTSDAREAAVVSEDGPGLESDGGGRDAAKDADAGDAADASDGDADADAAPVDSGPLSTTYHDRDINHILSTGQSNSVASGARPSTTIPRGTVAITSTQPYSNVMFDTGVMTSQSCNGTGCPKANYVAPTAFVPLVEGDSFFGGSYVVETASSAMANLVSRIGMDTFELGSPGRPTYPVRHDVLVSLHGRSGNKYVCLRKLAATVPGADCPSTYTAAFAEGMMQTQAAHDLATAAGKTHAVRAVTAIHGESDHNGLLLDFPMNSSDGVANGIKNYTDALVEWQKDYENGVKAITGQTEAVPLFIMGISGWTGPGPYAAEPESPRYSPLAAQQYDAHVAAPGKVVLVAPGYFLDQGTQTNVDTPECLHQSITGERQVGEYFAKAYAKVVFGGGVWEPVRPRSVTRAGAVVTIDYHVPVPPLVIDTTLVTKPAKGADVGENYGFEYRVGGHTGTRIPIASVALTGPTQVTITLTAVPVGADQRLLYAENQPPSGAGCTGPGIQANGNVYQGGARGNLRDSDATPSRYDGKPLYNWGVIYDVAVP